MSGLSFCFLDLNVIMNFIRVLVYRRRYAVREIQVFLRRNRIQLIIAVFCMLVTIKQMKAPFIFQYNAFTSFLFERIPSENVGGEILDLINNLGFAYYSSLVFYYVVDYFPTRKR